MKKYRYDLPVVPGTTGIPPKYRYYRYDTRIPVLPVLSPWHTLAPLSEAVAYGNAQCLRKCGLLEAFGIDFRNARWRKKNSPNGAPNTGSIPVPPVSGCDEEEDYDNDEEDEVSVNVNVNADDTV